MLTCSAPVDCTIPDNYTISFDADSDIDGIGVIAAFYIAAWVTVLLLAATYFSSAPEEFDNFGFSKLDILIVESFQRWTHSKVNPKTTRTFQKAIVMLSDQQLITGVSIGIVGLARLCEITQYHFNTVINLSLAASIAHSTTFSFIGHYINQNTFFRAWRAIAMMIFGALILVIWTVTGNNNWLEVYGLPAVCGYQNLGQGFGPPATISLGILYWFLLRGWFFAVAVLFPSFTTAGLMVTFLSTGFWLAQICELLQNSCKKSASQLHRHHKLLEELRGLSARPDLSFATRRAQYLGTFRAKITQGIWSFLCGASFLLFGLLYGVAQVWGSFAFNLCWTCYTLSGSAQIIASFRNTAEENGMNGSENEWSFGQQLPLLMLLLPALAMIEIFFDDPSEGETIASGSTFETNGDTSVSRKSSESQMKLFTSSSFSKATGTDDPLQEGYTLRRRVDTEQRVGMDISDARMELNTRSYQPTVLGQSSRGDDDTQTIDNQQEQEPNRYFSLWQIDLAENAELRDILYESYTFGFCWF